MRSNPFRGPNTRRRLFRAKILHKLTNDLTLNKLNFGLKLKGLPPLSSLAELPSQRQEPQILQFPEE